MMKRDKRSARFPLDHPMDGRPLARVPSGFKSRLGMRWKMGRLVYYRESAVIHGVRHTIQRCRRNVLRWG